MPAIEFNGITKLTNCFLVRGEELVRDDLWISSVTGKILSSQSAFFDNGIIPGRAIDLGGRIVSPGLIDVQLNGAFGFNFSSLPKDLSQYSKSLAELNKKLITTGVTSYLPTLTSQKPELYQNVLPYLQPREDHSCDDGAESLGAHVEGPFLNPTKNGIHDVHVMQSAQTFSDIEDCYGSKNLTSGAIAKITVAPERGQMLRLIPELRSKGIVCSIGHSEATYEEASSALNAGSTMITHLFNAMRPLHHRNPGVFGVLGTTDGLPRPFFGIIADGIHLHPAAIKIAFKAHPAGCILVTDAMHLVGLLDGTYSWTNGDVESRIVKEGPTLYLEGTTTIAGSSITLIECVNNFLQWTDASIAVALKAVTETPATMLGVADRKGCLQPGSDADLVILSRSKNTQSTIQLVVDEVWKFGSRVHESHEF